MNWGAVDIEIECFSPTVAWEHQASKHLYLFNNITTAAASCIFLCMIDVVSLLCFWLQNYKVSECITAWRWCSIRVWLVEEELVSRLESDTINDKVLVTSSVDQKNIIKQKNSSRFILFEVKKDKKCVVPFHVYTHPITS